MLFKGLKVLDLSHTLAGPFATMLLADLEADVIKVEPSYGDETRTQAPLINNERAYFMSINRGKESVAINLKHEKGSEIIHKLIKECDVFIENFRPNVTKNLRIDYKTLRKINPNIIYCSIKGFGTKSLYADKPAYNVIIQVMSGLMMTKGQKGRPPIRVSFALFDVFARFVAVTYVLAALYAGKKPSYIEVSMYDTAIFSMVYIPLTYLLTGKKPGGWDLCILPQFNIKHLRIVMVNTLQLPQQMIGYGNICIRR